MKTSHMNRLLKATTFACQSCGRTIFNDIPSWHNIKCGHIYCCVPAMSSKAKNNICPVQSCHQSFTAYDIKKILPVAENTAHVWAAEMADLRLALQVRDARITALEHSRDLYQDRWTTIKNLMLELDLDLQSIIKYAPSVEEQQADQALVYKYKELPLYKEEQVVRRDPNKKTRKVRFDIQEKQVQ